MLTGSISRTLQLVAIRRITCKEAAVSILGADEGFTHFRNYISVLRCFNRRALYNWMDKNVCKNVISMTRLSKSAEIAHVLNITIF